MIAICKVHFSYWELQIKNDAFTEGHINYSKWLEETLLIKE